MKLAAIICEYNPFHNGHRYQIEEIKRNLQPDGIIAIMSGNFVQRGIPAFCDKYSRATFALENGIDAVFELPVRYATSSAEFFASGAVFLLNSLNCIDYLVFGSESIETDLLDACAGLYLNEPEDYRQLLQAFLKEGHSFPTARSLATKQFLQLSDTSFLSMPNNILAIEYLKALKKYHSSITPYAIQRRDQGYHNLDLQTSMSSASSIRHSITQHGPTKDLFTCTPSCVASYLEEFYKKTYPVYLDDYSDMFFYQWMMHSKDPLYADYHLELIDRIEHRISDTTLISELVESCKTRNFTYSRIHRYLLHALLQIPSFTAIDTPYLKLLGFRKTSSFLLKHCKQQSSIPIIQKTAQYASVLDEDGQAMFEEDLRASRLYSYMIQKQYQTSLPEDTKRPLLIV